jgi:hypothetical protein
MVHDTQNYWVFGLRQSFGILETREHSVSENRSVSVLRRVGRHLLRWVPSRRANLSHWTTHVRFTTAIQIPEIRLYVSHFLQYRTMDEVQNSVILRIVGSVT